MRTELNSTALMNLGALLHLADPTLPIGGFNHSGGLETFVQQGVVRDEASLHAFVLGQLENNWVYNDGAYASLAFDAAGHQDLAALIELDTYIHASKAARELREASSKLGIRLLKIFSRHHRCTLLTAYHQASSHQQTHNHFALVFALCAHTMQLDKSQALYAFYHNAAVGVITNGVKLIPLSQIAGQDIVFALRTPIADAVAASMTPNTQWLGAAAVATDIRAMQHEYLYTRLYMS